MPVKKRPSRKPRVLVLNGPNLNLVGKGEPAIYGRITYADMMAACVKHGAALGIEVIHKQSNHEGALIEALHDARKDCRAVIINAGGFTHTSVALMDAIRLTDLPVVEVHLSNIYQREKFRHHSLISGVAAGVICGFGGQGYIFALDALAPRLKSRKK
ncbi:MAG: type II 3-dehydroquinate dehydratase [Alphaproteobacteria bacterium]|nr:type II 3-dehydroquinate dehydratase [Alphaproteobacteria bacterium]